MGSTTHDPSEENLQKGRGHAGAWVTGLLVLAALIAVATHFAEGERLVLALRRLEPGWLLVAGALQIATYLCAGGVWAGAVRAGGSTIRAATLARLGVVKLFIDQALPSAGLGGTAAVVRSLMRRGVGRPVAIAAMLVDLITHYAAFAALFAVAVLVIFLHHDLNPAVLSLSALFALAALGIPSAAVALHRGKPRWLVRAAGRFRWSRSFFASIEEASHPVLRSPRALAQAFALNASVFLLDTATLHILLTAVGVSAHASTSLAAFMLASAAGTLTILPGGLGTFEGVAVAVLNVLGVPLEAALLATLLFRGLSFWLPMVPGIFLTRGVVAS